MSRHQCDASSLRDREHPPAWSVRLLLRVGGRVPQPEPHVITEIVEELAIRCGSCLVEIDPGAAHRGVRYHAPPRLLTYDFTTQARARGFRRAVAAALPADLERATLERA